jgi:predicted RNase H-like HicB family nuclease
MDISVYIYTVENIMELEYTYFEADDGFFVGWFDDFPEDVTQGKSLEELEEMLTDLYQCLNLAKYHKRTLVLA